MAHIPPMYARKRKKYPPRKAAAPKVEAAKPFAAPAPAPEPKPEPKPAKPPAETKPDPSPAEWDPDMKKDALLAIAQSLDLDVTKRSKKAAIIKALESVS